MRQETEKLNQSQKILNAAFRCISTRGYANVSLRDIADEAGVVLSQLNYYYKNKDGLFTEVIKVAIGKCLAEVDTTLQQGSTIKEKMAHLIRYFQRILSETPELFRLLYDFIALSIWSDPFRELLRQLFQDLCDLVEKNALIRAAGEGKFEGYSSKVMARMIIGALFGITMQSILEPEKETFSAALDMIPAVFE
jgi:Transcriptional regulator